MIQISIGDQQIDLSTEHARTVLAQLQQAVATSAQSASIRAAAQRLQQQAASASAARASALHGEARRLLAEATMLDQHWH
mgnify:CR=1 FL=1